MLKRVLRVSDRERVSQPNARTVQWTGQTGDCSPSEGEGLTCQWHKCETDAEGLRLRGTCLLPRAELASPLKIVVGAWGCGRYFIRLSLDFGF